jgi:hypothetical protein
MLLGHFLFDLLLTFICFVRRHHRRAFSFSYGRLFWVGMHPVPINNARLHQFQFVCVCVCVCVGVCAFSSPVFRSPSPIDFDQTYQVSWKNTALARPLHARQARGEQREKEEEEEGLGVTTHRSFGGF